MAKCASSEVVLLCFCSQTDQRQMSTVGRSLVWEDQFRMIQQMTARQAKTVEVKLPPQLIELREQSELIDEFDQIRFGF